MRWQVESGRGKAAKKAHVPGMQVCRSGFARVASKGILHRSYARRAARLPVAMQKVRSQIHDTSVGPLGWSKLGHYPRLAPLARVLGEW